MLPLRLGDTFNWPPGTPGPSVAFPFGLEKSFRAPRVGYVHNVETLAATVSWHANAPGVDDARAIFALTVFLNSVVIAQSSVGPLVTDIDTRLILPFTWSQPLHDSDVLTMTAVNTPGGGTPNVFSDTFTFRIRTLLTGSIESARSYRAGSRS